jgi:hypothetical protein
VSVAADAQRGYAGKYEKSADFLVGPSSHELITKTSAMGAAKLKDVMRVILGVLWQRQ